MTDKKPMTKEERENRYFVWTQTEEAKLATPCETFLAGWQACRENEGSAIEEALSEVHALEGEPMDTIMDDGTRIVRRMVSVLKMIRMLQSIRDKYKAGKA